MGSEAPKYHAEEGNHVESAHGSHHWGQLTTAGPRGGRPKTVMSLARRGHPRRAGGGRTGGVPTCLTTNIGGTGWVGGDKATREGVHGGEKWALQSCWSDLRVRLPRPPPYPTSGGLADHPLQQPSVHCERAGKAPTGGTQGPRSVNFHRDARAPTKGKQGAPARRQPSFDTQRRAKDTDEGAITDLSRSIPTVEKGAYAGYVKEWSVRPSRTELSRPQSQA